jgi:ubiquinone/menaquinone biosynthesis C-methylase UbiE
MTAPEPSPDSTTADQRAATGVALSAETLREKAKLPGVLFRDGVYYDQAEPVMEWQWSHLIWPLIQGLDFECVVDLAAGHGRNSARLLPQARRLILVDINQECLDFCRVRFSAHPNVEYVKTDGTSLNGIADNSVSLLYTFDAMVHFDSDIVRHYLREFQRVLKPGGSCFCHHSNFTGNPGEDFARTNHWRNFMSKEMFAHYALKEGLTVVSQQVIDWSEPALDCLSVLRKPSQSAGA